MGHGANSLALGKQTPSSSPPVFPFSATSMALCAFSYASEDSGLFETLGCRSHKHIYPIQARSSVKETQPQHLDLYVYVGRTKPKPRKKKGTNEFLSPRILFQNFFGIFRENKFILFNQLPGVPAGLLFLLLEIPFSTVTKASEEHGAPEEALCSNMDENLMGLLKTNYLRKFSLKPVLKLE